MRAKHDVRNDVGIRSVLSQHAVDLVAIAMIAIGVIAAMAIWAEAAGPVGDGVDTIARVIVGRTAIFVPVVLVVGGIALIVGRKTDHRARIAVGITIVFLAVLALIHVVGATGGLYSGWVEISDGAGYVGAIGGAPLVSALGAAAAGVICVAVAIVGVLIATGTTLRAVGKFIVDAFALTRSRSERVAIPEHDASDVGATPTVTGDLSETGPVPIVDTPLYDYDSDSDEAASSQGVAPTTPSKPTVGHLSTVSNVVEPEQLEFPVPNLPDADLYTLPSLDLLSLSKQNDIDKAALTARGEIIESTLREFKVGARLAGIVAGPTVTRYEVELDHGVKVNKFTNLTQDIRYALATPDVRVLAPIPGRSAIGLEVPNEQRQLVTVGDILTTEAASDDLHPLTVALGRDIAGRPKFVNLGEMPHLLIAGATGSGKSSCINTILTSLLCRARPSEVRLILIDPKRVELGRYSKVPHLLTPVVTNPKRAADALRWATEEMDLRLEQLEAVGARDITSFNRAVERGEIRDEHGEPAARMPYIVVVVDELSDLMLVASRDVEDSIRRLAQMARAVGLHLVIATQRPSVDVITGVIKANIPTRMAFKVRQSVNSRVILDQGGAETLIGKGDLLYLGPSAAQTERIQTCFVEESEVNAVVEHWRIEHDKVLSAAQPDSGGVGTDGGTDGGTVEVAPAGGRHDVAVVAPDRSMSRLEEPDVVFSGARAVKEAVEVDDGGDELLVKALELVVASQLGSTSMLQRKLRVGFARAGRIMDLLEERGIVGPSIGSKARDVLITPDELSPGELSVGR